MTLLMGSAINKTTLNSV